MKKLSKTILSIAAVSAVSAVMAASAMAMTASYDAGSVTLAGVEATGDSQTLLVLSEDADTVTEAIIKQIDQKDDGSSFATVTVGDLAEGTYYVRVGGSNGTLQKAEFTIGEQGGGDVKTKVVVSADTDSDTLITSNDALQVARKAAAWTSRYGTAGTEYTVAADNSTLVMGDTDSDTLITSNDALQVARKAAAWTSRYGTAGTEYTVIDAE